MEAVTILSRKAACSGGNRRVRGLRLLVGEERGEREKGGKREGGYNTCGGQGQKVGLGKVYTMR